MDTFTVAILIDKLKKKRGKKWYEDLVKKTNKIVKYSTSDLEELVEKLEKKLKGGEGRLKQLTTPDKEQKKDMD